jgi:hypothetical protein
MTILFNYSQKVHVIHAVEPPASTLSSDMALLASTYANILSEFVQHSGCTVLKLLPLGHGKFAYVYVLQTQHKSHTHKKKKEKNMKYTEPILSHTFHFNPPSHTPHPFCPIYIYNTMICIRMVGAEPSCDLWCSTSSFQEFNDKRTPLVIHWKS